MIYRKQRIQKGHKTLKQDAKFKYKFKCHHACVCFKLKPVLNVQKGFGSEKNVIH